MAIYPKIIFLIWSTEFRISRELTSLLFSQILVSQGQNLFQTTYMFPENLL